MTFRDYLRIMAERWAVAATCLLVCVLGGVALTLIRPPEYTANTALYVSAQSGENPQQAFQGAQLSQQRVKSYTELATGTRVLGEVANATSYEGGPETLARNVTATNNLDSVIIEVAASDQDPIRAANIANAVADATVRTVEELERPTAINAPPPVALRVVQRADVPTEQSGVGAPAIVASAALIGFAFAIGAAFLLHSLDTSIRSSANLNVLTGVPNIGQIAFDQAFNQNPMMVHGDPSSPVSEAFRQLRTNLQFVDVDNERKTILFTSSVAGEGKSTTVANLATALASAGARVLVIEADLRRPRVSQILGMDRSVGLTSVLSGRVSPERAIQEWGGAFAVLASGRTPPNPSELLGSRQMSLLLQKLKVQFDFILIDGPPILPVSDSVALAPACDAVVLMCRYKQAKAPQVRRAVDSLSAVSASLIGTVITMSPRTGEFSYGAYGSAYKSTESAAQFIAVNSGESLSASQPSSAANRKHVDSPTAAIKRPKPHP